MKRMSDRETVIKGLEICSKYGSWHGLDCEHNEAYKDCPYRGCETGCVVTIAKDAIELLKEQEAVKPIEMQLMDDFSCFASYFLCSICGYELIGKDVMFCSHCGRAVKWE